MMTMNRNQKNLEVKCDEMYINLCETSTVSNDKTDDKWGHQKFVKICNECVASYESTNVFRVSIYDVKSC